MINKKDILSCDNNCIHKIVCKEIKNWTKYHNEHLELRKESILFDESPVCPYYKKDSNVKLEDNNCKCNDFSKNTRVATEKENESINLTKEMTYQELVNDILKCFNGNQ